MVIGSGPGMCMWYWTSTRSVGLYAFTSASNAASAATHGGHCASGEQFHHRHLSVTMDELMATGGMVPLRDHGRAHEVGVVLS